MTHRTSRTWYLLLALWLVGLLLALGSKIDEREEDEPADQEAQDTSEPPEPTDG